MKYEKPFLILLLLISGCILLMAVFGSFQSPEPMFEVGTPRCPPLEGGPYWTIYVDNLSTPENEMFILWEGYEGDLMDSNVYIPHENHTYHITYYGTDGPPKFNLTFEAKYNE